MVIKLYFCNMHSVITENISYLSETFAFCFNSSKEEIRPCYIHDLRVSIKRTRALLRMFKKINPETEVHKGLIVNLRKIFKGAALLRELHIFSVILSEYFPSLLSSGDFIRFFNKQEKSAKRKFHSIIKYSQKASEEYNKIQLIIKKEFDCYRPLYDDVNIDKLISEKVSSVKKLVAEDNINDQEFHKFRIKLKEINYIMHIRNDVTKANVLIRLKNFAGLLGVWHDHFTFSEFVNKYRCSKRKRKESGDLIKINNLETGFCDAEKKRIIFDFNNEF